MWRRKKLKGLTLVELLTAVGIMVFLLAVSIPLFVKNARVGTVDASAKTIEGVINRTRALAYNPDREFPVEYLANFQNTTENSISIILQAQYKPVNQDTIQTEDVDRMELKDVTIQPPQTQLIVEYLANSGALKTKSASTIVIKSKSGDSRTININDFGSVEILQ